MSQVCEIIARPPEGEDIRGEFERFLDAAEDNGWTELKMMFGFAWANYIYEGDWTEESVSPGELQSRVARAEANEDGAISEDDLFVTVVATGVQYTFCHENDIHLKATRGDGVIESETARYRATGWKVDCR